MVGDGGCPARIYLGVAGRPVGCPPNPDLATAPAVPVCPGRRGQVGTRIGDRDSACYSVRVPRRERSGAVRSYSSAEERSVHTGEVTGSNPVRTTTRNDKPLPEPGGVLVI